MLLRLSIRRCGRRLGGFRQNERRFALAEHVQLLADLHPLLFRTVLQLLDALAPVLILMLHHRIVLLQIADHLPLLEQRGNALRAAQHYVAVDADCGEYGGVRNPLKSLVHQFGIQPVYLFIILLDRKVQLIREKNHT